MIVKKETKFGTRTLKWCNTHDEPIWVWDDGSNQCPYELIVEVRTEHEIVDPPWEK